MGTILDAYFQDKQVNLPTLPKPSWHTLATLILQQAGSAPGIDEQPYEVYHYGVRFMACLLGQAVWAASRSDQELDLVLGESVDLLVWILKYPGAEEAAGMRPLQLPTCLRRLFCAHVASTLGPQIEPQLCPDQAATKGGHCGPNLTKAFQHLASQPPHHLLRPVPSGPNSWALSAR